MADPQIRAFRPQGVNNTVNIAVTAASQLLAIPNTAQGTRSIRVLNSGSQTIFLDFVTTSGTAALATSMPMIGNSAEVFTFANDISHVAVIAAATGSTMYITPGEGL